MIKINKILFYISKKHKVVQISKFYHNKLVILLYMDTKNMSSIVKSANLIKYLKQVGY